MRILVLVMICGFGLGAQPPAQKKGTPSKDAPGAKPEVQYRWDVQKSGVQEDLQSVSFVNRQVGYAAGRANTILKTTDGGNTWTSLMERNPSIHFSSVMFTSLTDGWAQADMLLHTADGGTSWQPASPLPAPANFGPASMLGSARIQLHVPTAGAGVFRSDDGGQSWKKLGQPPANSYTAVFFVDDQHGWVAGGGAGNLASTSDGGATWTEHPPFKNVEVRKIYFVTPETGWLLAHRGHQGGPMATNDGGKTWTNQYAGVQGTLDDMQFLNAQTGFLLHSGNKVMVTNNGGKNWRTIGTIQDYSKAISFPEADEGWAVGLKGYIVHYHKVEPNR